MQKRITVLAMSGCRADANLPCRFFLATCPSGWCHLQATGKMHAPAFSMENQNVSR